MAGEQGGDKASVAGSAAEAAGRPLDLFGSLPLPGGSESFTTVLVALGANVLIAAAKSAAAVVTGSASLLAEAAHSWADTGNEIFLLIANRRARRPPDAAHPLGHGREAYVWSLFAAVGLFVAGAVVSVTRGVQELLPRIRAAAVQALLAEPEVARVTYLRLEIVGPRMLFMVGAVDLTGDDIESHVAVRLQALEAKICASPAVVRAVLTLSAPDDPALPV